MSSHLLEIFEDRNLVDKIKRRLPYLVPLPKVIMKNRCPGCIHPVWEIEIYSGVRGEAQQTSPDEL